MKEYIWNYLGHKIKFHLKVHSTGSINLIKAAIRGISKV
jgi:hypothetical protein